MASTQAAALERLQNTIVDGRAENVRYRQDQLQNLYKTLQSEASTICQALSEDSLSSAVEVETEFLLALDAVRHFYDTLDFDKELEDEYSVANGKDNKGRRVPVGLVIIRPTTHTRFYSIINSLAAALSAGNCVYLEMRDTLLRLDAALKAILPRALDQNSFAIGNSAVSDQDTLDHAVLVDQTATGPAATLTNQLLSSSDARTVAIVDRTADIDLAAKAITTARFGFGGTSPYAPDLVLVNEFVKREFFEACSKYASLSFARGDASVKRKVAADRNDASRKAIREAEEKRQVSSFGSDDFKLVDILDQNTPVSSIKISGRYLPIATCSSLLDAVFNHDIKTPLLASYIFASPRSAKFLAQNLDAQVSLVNQIPAQLLLGPAAPLAHGPPDINYRYTKDMFSLARPQFAEPAASSSPAFLTAREIILGETKRKGAASVQSIRAQAMKPLKPTGQPKNEIGGFFETGFFIGAGINVFVVLPLVGYGMWVAGRKGLEYAARSRR